MQTRMETTYTRRYHAVAGAVGGVVAALVMATLATMIGAARGSDLAAPARLVAATFVGEEADPAAATFLGVGTHIVVGALVGALFGALTRSIASTGLLLAAGTAYGLLVFVLSYLVVPWIDPPLLANIEVGWFFAYHLAFGLTLGLTLWVWHRHPTRRWFGERYEPRRSRPHSAISGGGSSARGRTRSPAR